MRYKFCQQLLLLAFLLSSFTGKTQVFEKKKSITKSYAVNNACSFQISNKYGDINIIPWDKDSANFSVEIKVTDKKESDAERNINAIDVEFTCNPYFLIAKTVYLDNKSQVLKDISDMTNSLFNPGKNVEIKYIVNIPQTSAIKVENKYGNIYTTNHSGSVQFILSNGDLKANELTGSDTKIDLSFGNAVINSITNGKITTGYSDFEIKKAEKLTIESKSAKINITKADNLYVGSKRDKYNIDTVDVLNGQTDFSYINAYFLKESIFLKTLYGDINLTEIAGNFKFINLTSEYTDINLYFQKASSSTIDIKCKRTGLNYITAITGIQKQIMNEKTGEFIASGIIGTETQPKSSVQINAVSGSISINTK